MQYVLLKDSRLFVAQSGNSSDRKVALEDCLLAADDIFNIGAAEQAWRVPAKMQVTGVKDGQAVELEPEVFE